MKLYLIWQEVNPDYDVYTGAVVCAPDELTARHINPSTGDPMTERDWEFNKSFRVWAPSIEDVKVKYLGEAVEGLEFGLVLANK